MNPWKGLICSRKFWLLLLDTVMSLGLYFVGKYASASLLEDTKLVILAMQPVFVAIILAIAWEDAAQKGATLTYNYSEEDNCDDAADAGGGAAGEGGGG